MLRYIDSSMFGICLQVDHFRSMCVCIFSFVFFFFFFAKFSLHNAKHTAVSLVLRCGIS